MTEDLARFLDVRRHGFARVAVCVPRSFPADPEANRKAHLEVLREVYEGGAHYAVCPELGLSGYTCGDLFFQEALQTACLDALADLARATSGWNLLFTVGLPLSIGSGLFNCAVTLYRGRAVAVTPKSYLPGYREFYEPRWFQPAAACREEKVAVLGDFVPCGADVLVRARHLPGFVLHTEVCEDLWVPAPPSSFAALAGATVLANLSASNITVGKWEYRRDLVRISSARNLAVQLYTAAGYGESTSDLAWDGQGLIAERGVLLGETERFVRVGTSVVVDVDLVTLLQDRRRQGTFGANAAGVNLPPFRFVEVGEPDDTRDRAVYLQLRRRCDPHPFVPSDPARRDERCREVFAIQATSLARRIEALPAEGRRPVVGVSGGQDSTHALLVVAHATDLLGLPRGSIIGVTMPGLGTTERTLRNARALIRAVGATLVEIPINGLAQSVFDAVGHPPDVEDLTFENVQAWLRKLLLFAQASSRGGLDVGTGDLSELALGWCTYGGDHISHYGVNAGIPKTLVSYLIRWASETVFASEPEVQRVLRDVLATPISPELRRPGPKGEIVQRSEEIVGPYELQDFFLYHFLRFGHRPARLARMAREAFAGRYSLAEIRRWLEVFLRRFFASQFKRDCLPDGPKVGSGGALSPRGDWRMPSDVSPETWLAEVRAIPEEPLRHADPPPD